MAATKKAATAKKPRAKKAAPISDKPKRTARNKGKTNSAEGDSARAHEWLMQTLEANATPGLRGPEDDDVPQIGQDMPLEVHDVPDEDDTECGPTEEDLAAKAAASARGQQLEPFRWKPGQSGNPKGRKKGSRNQFAEAFISDFLSDWEEYGSEAIRECRETRLDVYMATARAIIPKQMDVRVSEFEQLTDDGLDQRIADLASQLGELQSILKPVGLAS